MSYVSEVLSDSPRVYLRLGETSGTNANDETANNLDGTYVGSPTLGITGAITSDVSANRAVTLNGTSQRITIADNNLLDLTGDWTLEAWIKKTSTASLSAIAYIVDKGASQYGLGLDANDKLIGRLGAATQVTGTTSILDTNWHHVAVTKSGTTYTLYLDRASNGSATVAGTPAANTNPVGIGASQSGASFFPGSLDEVAIYPTALSLARIQAHYDAATTSNVSPTAGFTYSGSGLTFSFTDTSSDPDGTIASRLWDFGDSTTSTATNPSHTYSTGGSKTVTLTVTDNGGATDSDVQTITAVSNNPPVAGFTYTGTGLTRAFTDTSTDSDGTVVSRAWNFGDGTTSTSTNPSKTWAANGTYTVTLTVTDDDGATDSEIQSVTVAQAGAGKAYLSKAIPLRTTTLDGGVSASQSQVPVADLSYWPATGEGLIDSEKITWTGKSAPSGVGNLTGVSRGQFGTLAATHSAGATVSLLNRHDGGILTRRKIPTFPIGNSITLQELRRHTDSQRFVWADFSNFREYAELTITGTPNSSGNVSTTLDEGGTPTTRTAAVSGAKEKRSLTINNAATSSGNATLTLNGTAYTIIVTAGVLQVNQIICSGTASATKNDGGNIYSWPAGNAARQTRTFAISSGDDASTIANRIHTGSYSGWTTAKSGATVTATATTAEPRGISTILDNGFQFSDNVAGVSQTGTILTPGQAGMTAIQVADLIRITNFPGYVTGGTPGTATVTIEALEAGPQAGTFSYSAGTTGATSTSGLTQTTAGSATSTDAVATAIRAAYSGNTYWTVGGSGSLVTWLATSTGSKQDATFSSGGTGTRATMETVNQGSSDIVVFIQDSAGVQCKRRVLANIATTTPFYIETSVSGAGTDKAVVTCYGSFAGDPLTHVWRVTEVDLSEHPLGEIAYGVTEESATGLIWDVHTDEVEVTDRGKTYHHDHDQIGNLIGQAHYYGRLETIQSRNDIFVQDLSITVIPGEEVVMAAKLRHENAPTELPAKPLFVTAHHADGTVTDLRDVTGTTGISGTAAWNEPTPYTFTVPTSPSPCYEIRVASRDMSSGSIVLQELVVSPGTLPKRTYYYATDGTVTVRYDGRTPQETNAMQLGRQRVALETQYEKPAGTLTSERYRAADDPDALESATWYSNPLDVPGYPVPEIEATLTGDGLSTPKLLSGFPRFEYKLVVGTQDQPTLNKPDGTEFPGMVVFDKREEWYPNTGIDVRVLPSGRVRRGKTHEPVGYIPKLSLWAFRPEAVKYLSEKWGTEELIADWVDDEVLTLKLLSSPEFERQHGTKDGPNGRAAEWKSKEIAAEVVSVRKRIT